MVNDDVQQATSAKAAAAPSPLTPFVVWSRVRTDAFPWCVAGLALVLTLGYVPGVGFPGWSVRAVVLLPFAGAGIVLVAAAARTQWAPRLGLCFLLVGALSATLSPAPLASWLGPRGWFTGVLPIACIVGIWAVGRVLDQRGQGWFAGAVLAGACLNAVAGLFQSLDILPLHVPDSAHWGRPMAFMANPVHFGTLAAAALALAGRRFTQRVDWVHGLLVATLGFAVNLSGGRAALASGVVGFGLAVARAPRRTIALAVLCVALGSGAASLLASPGGAGSARISTSASGARTDVWRAGLDAAVERPLLGWGPGRFEAESTQRRSLSGRQAEYAPFVDAHNWPIEYATTTGVLGSLSLLAWLLAAARNARGGLALFALVIAVNGLLQPAFVGTTPLAALALGAATSASRHRRTGRPALGVALGLSIGLAAASSLLVTELAWGRIAPTPRGLHALADARRAFPDSAELLGDGANALAQSGRMARAEGLASRALSLDPTLAANALRLASIRERRGDVNGALEAYERALELDPWSAAALRGIARMSAEPSKVDAACARLLQLLPRTTCEGPR